MSRKLKVDPELQELLPPLDEEQRERLKALIEKEGCQDSIKVWKGKGVIVDGHHRYAICNELKCEFEVTELTFADKGEAAEWMVTHQDARRNSTPAAISTARGMAYNLRKQKQGGDRKSPRAKSIRQVDGLISSETETAAEVAEETGVSQRTVERDGQFQESLSKLPSTVRQSILAGEVRKPTQKALERLGEYDSPSQVIFVNSVKSGEFPTVTAALDAEEKPAKKGKVKVELSPEEQAKANRKLAYEYLVKTMRAVDSYHAVKPDKQKRSQLINLLKQVGENLW